MDKIDYRKVYQELYQAKAAPALVDVASMNFLMIDGQGDPQNAPEFHVSVEALFSLAYTLKFQLKNGAMALDFSVMPLEGLWWTEDMSRFLESRERWQWTLMIMQPPVVDAGKVQEARAALAKKKDVPALERIRFERYDEGQAVQLLHIGPYAEEGASVSRLHEFAKQQGYRLTGKHHEIYLSDARRTAPEKLKTILRQPVS